MKLDRRLLVLSIDAFVYEDVEYAMTLPNFKELLSGCSWVKRVETVYPTLTYPCHVSMATGCYPDKHGIYNNELDDMGEKGKLWHWYANEVKVPSIFDAAHEAGYSTGAINWPVQVGNSNIDYLLPEIWLHPGCGYEDLPSLLEAGGANAEMKALVEKYLVLFGDKIAPIHPGMDNFAMEIALEVIKKHAPEVMFLHDSRVDGARHRSGVFSSQVREAIDEMDYWLGRIIGALKEAGVYEQTDFVITSDHGQINITRYLNANVILADKGFITVGENGEMTDYKAYIKSAALSGHVFMKHPDDEKERKEVWDLLCWMRDEGVYGIGEVFTAEEVKEKWHLEGGFSFVVETDGYTSFGNELVRPIVRALDLSDYKFGAATHGHLPFKGPQPTVLFRGPHFAENVVIENGVIVDEAPVYAKLLGVELPDADGKPFDGILK